MHRHHMKGRHSHDMPPKKRGSSWLLMPLLVVIGSSVVYGATAHPKPHITSTTLNITPKVTASTNATTPTPAPTVCTGSSDQKVIVNTNACQAVP